MHFNKNYTKWLLNLFFFLLPLLLEKPLSLLYPDGVGSTLFGVRGSSVSRQIKFWTPQSKYCQLSDLCVVLVMRTTVFHGFR
jgi:hypothetical protein